MTWIATIKNVCLSGFKPKIRWISPKSGAVSPTYRSLKVPRKKVGLIPVNGLGITNHELETLKKGLPHLKNGNQVLPRMRAK